MIDLARWLEDNLDKLVNAALAELTRDVTQQAQAADAVESFFQGLLVSVQQQDTAPLYTVLE